MSLEREIEFSMCLLAQMAIRKLAKMQNCSDDEMAAVFMQSTTAQMLFDRETGLFGYGPDYIANEYMEELARNLKIASDICATYKA
ncbi:MULTISPECIES: hypothetical protein [unclassified Fibrobacter]|uniref:hypothetical protein n=1 Tax=unclassified Fibrobacter TaxID=2634177 RepID=UPI000D6B6ADA|nr:MULTISPECIES: hypothetical protein [unclassified Fibrobacter]PWJ68342.1 hypothetical protein BGX12_10868 [Fibrobacter sp. UWR4]PZW68124.1 hypothetical protein C8E88_102031 [Fibrobacter sp. UWR1]